MKATQIFCTFSAKSSSAQVATKWVTDEIMGYARDNDCAVVTISHAMAQQDDMIEVTAIAIFQKAVY